MTGLSGCRVGITSARKVGELTSLLERRGAAVEWAPVLSVEPNRIDEAALCSATRSVLAEPVDMFVATTGIGVRAWFEAAATWGMLDELRAVLAGAEIIARGPKSVGALRAHGLRELWTPRSECFEEVLAHLRDRSLHGMRIVVQEHGQSLSVVADALRRRGADVTVVTVYRIQGAEDRAPTFAMVDLIADRRLDAVTFTSAPAVLTLMDVATAAGRREEVLAAFKADVVATCVGPVTAAPFEMWGVPTLRPGRSRLAAMVRTLEVELPRRRAGTALQVAGRTLLFHGDAVTVDAAEVYLSPAPLAVLHALAEDPGRVLSRKQLMSHLPSGLAVSEHAVEVAIARLRAGIGTRQVQTVVKRGYRLPVG